MQVNVTLFWFVLPKWFMDMGGFEKEENIAEFVEWGRLAFELFGEALASCRALILTPPSRKTKNEKTLNPKNPGGAEPGALYQMRFLSLAPSVCLRVAAARGDAGRYCLPLTGLPNGWASPLPSSPTPVPPSTYPPPPPPPHISNFNTQT